MKANYVGIGGLVFSDGKILDYNQLLPLFNEMKEKIEILERDLGVANRTINQYGNETIELLTEYDSLDSKLEKLMEAVNDAIGECGLNGSLAKLEKLVEDMAYESSARR